MGGRLLFTIGIAIAVLTGLGSMPDVVRLPEPAVRVAHGTVALVRVIDAGDAELMPLPPDELDERLGGAFSVDERNVLYLWDHENARILVYEDASLDRVLPVDEDPRLGAPLEAVDGVLELGSDADGARYDVRAHRDGWLVARRDPQGDALAMVEILRADVDVWDWFLRPDGAVFALSWRKAGDAWRLSLFRVLSPVRSSPRPDGGDAVLPTDVPPAPA